MDFKVRVVGWRHRHAVISALTEAFADAEYFRRLYRNPIPAAIETMLRSGERRLRWHGGRTIAATRGGDVLGAAVILEPTWLRNVEVESVLGFLRERFDKNRPKLEATPDGERYHEFCEQHSPDVPHVSVLYLGVAPPFQGAGVGTALLRRIEKTAADDQWAECAHLSTANVSLAATLLSRGWAVERGENRNGVIPHSCPSP